MAEYEAPEPKRDFKVAAVGSGVKGSDRFSNNQIRITWDNLG